MDTFLEIEITQAWLSGWSRVLHQPQIFDSGVLRELQHLLKRGLIKTINGEEKCDCIVRRICTSQTDTMGLHKELKNLMYNMLNSQEGLNDWGFVRLICRKFLLTQQLEKCSYLLGILGNFSPSASPCWCSCLVFPSFQVDAKNMNVSRHFHSRHHVDWPLSNPSCDWLPAFLQFVMVL